MLDQDILSQLQSIFSGLNGEYLLKAECDTSGSDGREMADFVNEVATASPNIRAEVKENPNELRIQLYRNGEPLGISFRGVPGGHEFNTFLLAILNADGKGLNLPDAALKRRIESLNGPIDLDTYVSLSCTNCPDVAQANNLIALFNDGVTNTVIDGGKFQKEVQEKGIQAVPMVLVGETVVSVGRSTLSELLGELETRFGVKESGESAPVAEREFDVLVLGGGPAGASASIYSARKGLKTAVVATEAGGSVNLTGDIENLITTRLTTGNALAGELKGNMRHYGVELFEDRVVTSVSLKDDEKVINVAGGEVFKAPQIIIATGSKPRKIGVPGEEKYIGKGVAFCPHCDGPLFKGKRVAVIGGGNAGIEAAIDLAGICKSIVVFEFLDELKADEVLAEKARTLPNVSIFTGTQVMEIKGDGQRVNALEVKERSTGEVKTYDLEGVFVQIGTIPNTRLFDGQLALDKIGQIETDRNCRTNLANVYAAGDVANGPFNQIVTALGEGAIAALTAFDDKIRKK